MAKKYAEITFDGNYLSTIGIDFKIKELEINKLKYKILLIDPSNLIFYKSLNINYDGIIFIYDSTEITSINGISHMIKHFREKKDKNFPMILLGNKMDKKNIQINEDKRKKFAKINGIEFYEISYNQGDNIEASLNSLINSILKFKKKGDGKREEKEKLEKKGINIAYEKKTQNNGDDDRSGDGYGCCGSPCKLQWKNLS